MSSQLEVIPLGGLGEFGMNCAALRAGDDLILVDAGMMLPDRGAVTSLGVDLMVPDISFLLENRRQLRAIVLTHGHEDHAGGVSYIIDQLQVPVYGNRLTLGLVSSRLRERGLDKEADLRLLEPDRPVDLGAFQVEPLRVTHSFPESYCFAIRTPVGRIIWTGDFKFDQTPIDGRRSNLARLAELGQEGVLALFSDSTNGDVPGLSPSESSVYEPLQKLFRQAEGKIVLATFASSMHRIQIVLDLARDAGRKVVPMGRSMVSNIRLASQLGYLRTDPEVLRSRDNLARIPSDRLIVLASGSQGEPMSAMSRLSVDEVRQTRIEAGDLVLLSSRIIPGNEKGIGQMINHFNRRGARVLDSRHQPIHASGHGYREDLKLMIDLTRPRFFVPIHGEYRQLAAHARLARRQGIPPDQVHLLETGEVLGLSPDKAEILGQVTAGRRFIDEGIRRPVDQEVLRDRRFLAMDGVLVVGLRIDLMSWELIGEPELISRGFVRPEDSQELMQETRARIRRLVSETGANGKRDEGLLGQMLQTGLKRFLRKRTRKRPLIIPVMLTL
jgi:ribonuclease J